MANKLTIADVKQRLIDDARPIRLVKYGYSTNDHASEWECHKCSHRWCVAARKVIFQKSGCPMCAGNMRLTLETINQRLRDNNTPVVLLKYGRNTRDASSLWMCTKCGNEWNIQADSVLHKNIRCPRCSFVRHVINQEMVKKKLVESNRPIELLEFGSSATDKSSLWNCTICNHKWNTSSSSILNNNTGCPSCAGVVPLTEKIITRRLIEDGKPIELLWFGRNAMDCNTLWKCTNCGNTWNTNANNIFSANRGCPQCATSGFKKDKPGYVYLHTYKNFLKIGITHNPHGRYTKLNNQATNGVTHTIKSTISWYFEDGAEAIELESIILDKFKPHAYTKLLETTFDGKTELFEHSAHQKILDYIKDNYDISLV